MRTYRATPMSIDPSQSQPAPLSPASRKLSRPAETLLVVDDEPVTEAKTVVSRLTGARTFLSAATPEVRADHGIILGHREARTLLRTRKSARRRSGPPSLTGYNLRNNRYIHHAFCMIC
jgi:hypothetical protein